MKNKTAEENQEEYTGALCGDSICPKCKVRIPMEEGVLFHYEIYHPRTKRAKESRELSKKWNKTYEKTNQIRQPIR